MPRPWLYGMDLDVFLYLSMLRAQTEYSVKLVGSVSLSCPMSKTHLCGNGPCSQMGHKTTHLPSSSGAGLSFGQGHVSRLNTCQWPLEPVPQECSEIDQVKVTTVKSKYKMETRLMNCLCRQNHLSHGNKMVAFHEQKQNLI